MIVKIFSSNDVRPILVDIVAGIVIAFIIKKISGIIIDVCSINKREAKRKKAIVSDVYDFATGLMDVYK